ncbi:MAG: hypothetical protein Q8Q90_01935 [bacterium]|nr:hypothetical protein [bacterium]
MKDSLFHPEELTIQDKSPLGSSYAETFVFVPSNKNEATLGSLFIVTEASSNKTRKENAELTSEIASVIKNEFYQNTLVTPMSALKFSLKRVNTLLNSKKNWLTPSSALKLKVLIASLKENKLHIARMGDSTAFLLRDNLLQTIAMVSNSQNQNSLSFENIISGELLPDDHILLATNQIYKIDEKEILKNLQEKKMVSHLSKANNGIKSLAMISIHPVRGRPAEGTASAALGRLTSNGTKPSLVSIHNEANIPDYPTKNKGKFFKIGIVVTILLVAISIITTASFKIKNETSQNKKESEQLLQEVSDIKNKVNDLIAANNEIEANELLFSAQEKLKRLEELGYFKTTRSTLSADLEKIYKEISKAETINKINKVFDLENNSVGFEPEKITLGKNKIFVLGGKNFYKFDFNKADGIFDSVEEGSTLVSSLLKPENPNSQILITQDKIMEELGDSQDKTYWIRPENIPAIKDAFFYTNAIYLLSENGFIYKMPFTLSSSTTTQSVGNESLVFGEVQTWTKSEENKLESFSIEGSVFGLIDSNTLAELTNGEIKNKKNFSENISHVFTSVSYKNIYLFSPDNGLVIILDKNLNIKKRLSHSELVSAKSFLVNSQERVIYFLKGKTVYSFEI